MHRATIVAAFILASVPQAVSQEQAESVFRLQLPGVLLMVSPGGGEGEGPGEPEQPAEPLAMSGPFSVAARLGVQYEIPLSAQGGSGVYQWQVDPANTAGAAVSGQSVVGVPQSNGSHSVGLTLLDGVSEPVTGSATVAVTSPAVTTATAYQVYTGNAVTISPNYVRLLDTGALTRTYALSPSVAGLSMGSDGIITGIPSVAANTSGLVASVVDTDGSPGSSAPFSINVLPATPTVKTDTSRISSITGGTVSGGGADRIAATSNLSYLGVDIGVGTTLQTNYTMVVSAPKLFVNFRSISGSSCNAYTNALGQFSMDLYLSTNNSTWVKNSQPFARTSVGYNCNTSGGSVTIDADKRAFRYTRLVPTSITPHAGEAKVQIYYLRAGS